ncbi:HAD hydrolase-like protein [Streptomyces sp. NBC_01485]|uniref:HAD family hydrolase n=1 Tax=Streptomyces sp. NBC_01485 TaxID=2903884 RepID=UPI002E3165DA|nr:HAD family hydrolase [Streptomyces sp. NBC_01485]
MVRRPLGNHHDGPDTLLVTSHTTQTEQVAPDSGTDTGSDRGSGSGDEAAERRKAITRARVVLWDFDGPMCRLFAGHSAQRVAQELMGWLEGRGLHRLLTETERHSLDPHVVVRAVDRVRPGSDLAAELEERLTQEELLAVASAMPTAYADPLIRTWAATGPRLAITTNNSPRVVTSYLAGRGLTDCFTPHIYGRTQDLRLLKPHPRCLHLALRALGSAPEDALMIGDTPSDFAAADAAGVPFLGYARNADKERRLRGAGAALVVNSLETVLETVRRRA